MPQTENFENMLPFAVDLKLYLQIKSKLTAANINIYTKSKQLNIQKG